MSFFSILPIGSLFLTLPDANSLSWAIPVALIPLIPVSFKELSAAQKGAVIVGTSISHYKVTEKIGEDGRRIVWVGNGQDEPLVYTRALDSLEVHALEGTRGLNSIGGLAISPDGGWLAFLRDGELWKIPVEGGVATPLVDISEFGSQIEAFDWGRRRQNRHDRPFGPLPA